MKQKMEEAKAVSELLAEEYLDILEDFDSTLDDPVVLLEDYLLGYVDVVRDILKKK